MKPTIGKPAPDFTVSDQNGNAVTLSSLRGKKIVLYFYPKDMTPGCTLESCNLRDNYKLLQKQGYEVLGISSDDAKSHRKFIEKEKLPFRLLADTDKKVHEQYGTWVEKSMYGRKYMGTARVTFVINANGVIEDIIEQVDTKNHTAQILGEHTIKSTPKASAPVKKTSAKPKKKAVKKSAPAKKTAARKGAAGKKGKK